MEDEKRIKTGTDEEQKLQQMFRSRFCDFLDLHDDLAGATKRHLFWWYAKEALYHLGVATGDITQIMLGDDDGNQD